MPSFRSFGFAFRGLKTVVSSERNAQIHVVFALLAIIGGIIFHITKDEFLVVILAIILVFFAEIINTALERTLDLTYHENNQLVRYVKDTTAAGVLVAAGGAFLVAIIIFGPHVLKLFGIS